MSRFRATIQGNRGLVSRTGSKSSGMTATISGWGGSLEIEVFVDKAGKDRFSIRHTSLSGRHTTLATGALNGDTPDLPRPGELT